VASFSFDPNTAKRWLVTGGGAALENHVGYCDSVLASGERLTLLTQGTTPERPNREILGLGVTVHRGEERRRGGNLPRRHGSAEARRVIPWTSWTPTGAGDCFGATFITWRLQAAA